MKRSGPLKRKAALARTAMSAYRLGSSLHIYVGPLCVSVWRPGAWEGCSLVSVSWASRRLTPPRREARLEAALRAVRNEVHELSGTDLGDSAEWQDRMFDIRNRIEREAL